MAAELSAAQIAGIVIVILVVVVTLLRYCCPCCRKRDRKKNKKESKDIEKDPKSSDTPLFKRSVATQAVKSVPDDSRPPKSFFKRQPVTTTVLGVTPPSRPAPNPYTGYFTTGPPITNRNSTSSYRRLENARDSLDLLQEPPLNPLNTRRSPTPPQNLTSILSSNQPQNQVGDIPELRSLRTVSSPPTFSPTSQPPPIIVSDHTQTDETDEVYDLPSSPHNGSSLGMHDEGPSRKSTPRFTVPITRPQTAASNYRSKSTTSILSSELFRRLSGSSSSRHRRDQIANNPINDHQMTELSRSGTRAFTPKVRASRTIDIRNPAPMNSRARRSEPVAATPPPPPRELILNEDGLTPAQLARNLPRRGFTPKVRPVVVQADGDSVA